MGGYLVFLHGVNIFVGSKTIEFFTELTRTGTEINITKISVTLITSMECDRFIFTN